VIGIDLDNTIADHDAGFRRAAATVGIVPAGATTARVALRDGLRRAGREDEWTTLQGRVYGPLMEHAAPYPGVLDFLAGCRRAGLPVAIVSQRSRLALGGEPHDLHAPALGWLDRHGFHDPARGGLPRSLVFLEETRARKLARIEALGCTHFIDDLPEVLAAPGFPGAVRRMLFDPLALHAPPPGVHAVRSWHDVAAVVLGSAAR